MISRIHNKLGTAGFVVAIVALVAALGGGAVAAQQGLNGRQKNEVKKIAQTEAKKVPGVPGPAGPQGPAGAKGDTGATGPEGKQGPKGDQGKQGIQGPEGPEGPPGSEGPEGPAGEDGTFSTEPLPVGETLTGVWATYRNGTNKTNIPISFPIRVTGLTAAVLIDSLEGAVQWNPETGTPFGGEIEELPGLLSIEEGEAFCPGDEANPSAVDGYVCIYGDSVAYTNVYNAVLTEGTSRAVSSDPTSGVVFPYEGLINGRGSWAVTSASS